MSRLIVVLCLSLSIASVSISAFASDVLTADRYYGEGQYELAREAYLEASKIGNPRAYYQLATMYYKGVGVEKDVISGLIYFALAAEYDFFNSKSILDSTLNTLPESSRAAFLDAITEYKSKHGKAMVDKAYFPEIDTDQLGKFVTFDGKPKLEDKFFSDDALGVNSDSNIALESLLDGSDEVSTFLLTSTQEPLVILDVDIAPDGIIRHVVEVQKSGSLANGLINDIVLFPKQKPEFQDENIDFVGRIFGGAAVHNKFTLLKENEGLYREIIKQVKRLKRAEALNDRYQYAVALLNFKWIKQEEDEAETLLLEIARDGHPAAMYEYGMLLYREQRSIPEAVYWISQASKYGLVRAEYRLGKILHSSPWVKRDDKKALLWLESAFEQGHVQAGIRAAAIKLTSKDASAKDVDGAVSLLAELQGKHKNNPEYYYLLGLSFRDRAERDFSKLKSNLSTAIFRGKLLNWDVSEWQAMLTGITTGNVFSCEVDSVTDQCVR